MNACSLSSRCKRAILHPQHATPRVAEVPFASFLAGRFGMRRTGKVRPFTAFKRSTLFRFRFLGRYTPGAVLPQFFAYFFGPFVPAVTRQNICVPSGKVLVLRQTLQVFQSVVRFVAVNMVDLFGGVKTSHPTFSYNTMQQVFTADKTIPVRVFSRRVWAVLSENFPAARNGVVVVENPVFNAVNFKANHVVSPLMANKILHSIN